MTIRKKFRKSPGNVLSFDFQDTLRNQSYITFYGGEAIPEASVIQKNYEETADADLDMVISSNYWFAQTFTPSEDIWINKVEFYGRRDVSGNAIAYISTVNGSNLPITDEILARAPFIAVSNVNNWNTSYDFSGFIKLTSGVTYALIIDGMGDTYWRADTSSPTHSGQVAFSSNNGDSWVAQTTKDALFRVYGFTVNPYILFTETFDSHSDTFDTANSPVKTVDGTFFKRLDVDMDLEFGVSAVLRGKAIINLTITGEEGSGNDSEYYLIAKLRKFDGTTETDITSTQDITRQLGTDPADVRHSIILDIDSNTPIRSTDILRLTIEGWMNADTKDSTPTLKLHHNPNGTTNLIIHIPFKGDN